jgi:hypothetical protein
MQGSIAQFGSIESSRANDPTTKKSLFVNFVSVDGVTIVDSNKNSVSDLLGVLKDLGSSTQGIAIG